MSAKVNNYLNYVNVNSKSLDISKCCKYLIYFLYDKEINILLSENIKNWYDEKCFDFVICNEHKEDVKYAKYIKLYELFTI
ncbi:CYIR protein [Plasmodium cynomolgi strain B]|uniref:CYIR protein n=1 Tax=Plasmodium cynomolgi (strain B) TaxID=1120755 RepID=K6V2V4_PLACD|nr:CYIR protein [Plasmodium cynomolgi strain B]GAB69635.1 CYIR protein [Plasmodium cynomolgi strain B]